KKLYAKGDRVLIDAPCTGLGVLRRNPDAKWKLSEEFLAKILITQQEILSQYAKMVKPGGKLVYATCSILPQENTEQIERFLTTETGKFFELEEEKHIWAAQSGYDGFYMARLSRSN
ncbi:MAG: RNA methyltransferase, partial [Flavobacteriaceae bacterium]